MDNIKARKKQKNWKVNRNIFIIAGLAFPLIQFFLFYICVNFNSVILAFKEYLGNNDYQFIAFENFITVINSFRFDSAKMLMLKNSTIMALFSLLMIILNAIVTYLIWKKPIGSGFFKVILFLPSIISSIVFVVVYRYMITDVLPIISGIEKWGEILNAPQGFTTLLILSGILGFGPSLLVFLGSMSTISDSLVEYGKIDGMNLFQEFWYLIIPHIYPTIISYTVITIATFFSNYGLIFSFYEAGMADITVRTLGYDIFARVYAASNFYEFPVIAATGLLYTIITIPIVLGTKKIMEVLGPKEY